jgi:hypothetical protein
VAAAATAAAGAPPSVAAAVAASGRPEGRKEGVSETAAGDTLPMRIEVATRAEAVPEQRRWRSVDLPESAPDQTIYRPASDPVPEAAPTRPATRVEAR